VEDKRKYINTVDRNEKSRGKSGSRSIIKDTGSDEEK
jgi:hypothetical protein